MNMAIAFMKWQMIGLTLNECTLFIICIFIKRSLLNKKIDRRRKLRKFECYLVIMMVL